MILNNSYLSFPKGQPCERDQPRPAEPHLGMQSKEPKLDPGAAVFHIASWHFGMRRLCKRPLHPLKLLKFVEVFLWLKLSNHKYDWPHCHSIGIKNQNKVIYSCKKLWID